MKTTAETEQKVVKNVQDKDPGRYWRIFIKTDAKNKVEHRKQVPAEITEVIFLCHYGQLLHFLFATVLAELPHCVIRSAVILYVDMTTIRSTISLGLLGCVHT